MPDDKTRRALQALDQREGGEPREPETSLWELISGIHKDPQIREWMTLESRPLLPFLQRGGQGWVVNVLVSATASSGEVLAPWAWLAWSWPDARLLAMVDVRDDIAAVAEDMPRDAICTEAYCAEILADLDGGLDPREPPGLAAVYEQLLRRPLGRSLLGPERSASLESVVASSSTRSDEPVSTMKTLVLLLNESRAALADGELADLLPWLRRIRGLLDGTHFSVAVAGEFSRGKSTLVNRLVGEELLSVGDLPTTAVPAIVRHADTAAKFFRSRDGRRQEVPMTAETNGEIDSGAIDGLYEVQVPAEWMKDSGLQLIDTPGVGAPDDPGNAFASEAIATSDATIVAVSATMPLSLTERGFVEQEVLGGAVPRLAVVVTRLDQVSEQHRLRVVEHIAESVASWAPNAEVWASFGSPTLPQEATLEVAGIPAIQRRLAEWAGAPEHQSRRLAQVHAQLAQLLEAAQSAVEFRLELAERAMKDDERQLQAALDALDRDGLRWGRVRTEFSRREMDAAAWFERKLGEALGAAADDLAFAVGKHPNPHEWWAKEFSVLFKRRIGALLAGLEAELQRRLRADAAWLRSAMAAEFEWETAMLHEGSLIEPAATSDERTMEAVDYDLESRKRVARVGTLVVGLAAGALAGPLGVAVMTGGALATEVVSKHKLSDQQSASATAVRRMFEDRADDICLAGVRRLRGAYRKLEAQCEREQAQWRGARTRAAEQVAAAPDRDQLVAADRELLRRLKELQSRNTTTEVA